MPKVVSGGLFPWRLALAGIEWLLEIFGCPEVTLRDRKISANFFQSIISEKKLNKEIDHLRQMLKNEFLSS